MSRSISAAAPGSAVSPTIISTIAILPPGVIASRQRERISTQLGSSQSCRTNFNKYRSAAGTDSKKSPAIFGRRAAGASDEENTLGGWRRRRECEDSAACRRRGVRRFHPRGRPVLGDLALDLADPGTRRHVRRCPPIAAWRQRTPERHLRPVRQRRPLELAERI